jgi:outer membrane protein assembly factor BamB
MRERALRRLLVVGMLSGLFLLPVTDSVAQSSTIPSAEVRLIREQQRPRKAAGLAVTGNVLAIREGNVLFGLDSLSLRQRWRFDQFDLVAGPFRAGEHLFAVSKKTSRNGDTYSLIEIDPKTGSLIWGQEMSEEALPISGCGAPAFLFNEGSLLWKTHTLFWDTQNPTPTKLEIPDTLISGVKKINWKVSWLSAHHLVLAGEGTVLAADLTDANRLWTSSLSGKITHIHGCGPTLLVEIEGGCLVGIEESSGRVIWRGTLGHDQSLVDAGAGMLFVVDPKGSRERIDSQNGARQPVASLTPAPGPITNAWYTPDVLGAEDTAREGIKLYDSASGHLLWASQPSEPARSYSPLSIIEAGVKRLLGDADKEGFRIDVLQGYVSVSSGSGLLQVLGISRAQNQAVSLPQAISGILDIKTDPEEAFLWVDGFLIAQGVRRIQGLAPGPHHLSVFHPDREVYEATVDLKATGVQELSVVLERVRDVGLSITTNPGGAIIYIDGRNTGFVTPYTFYDFAQGQTLKVQLFKLGYGELQWEVKMGSEGAQINEKLKLSSLLGTIFVRGGQMGFGTIKGWNEPDIRTGSVEGRPVRSPRGEASLGAEGSLEVWVLRDLALAARADISVRGYEGEAGIWVSGGGLRKLQAGISYLDVYPEDLESSPPSKSHGFGSDESAPLERWHHPIPRVFVNNDSRDYLVVHLRARPQADLLLELAVGRLLTARLQGTALVEGTDGHLVRDPERFYDLRSHSGNLIDFKLRKGLGAFRLWRIFPSTTFEARYRRRTIDFGPAREQGQEVTIGLGLMVF